MTDIITAELHGWSHYTIRGKTIVSGKIHGDVRQRFPDGHEVNTSYVTHVDGDVIRTYSGSSYRLVGDPVGDLPPLDATKINTPTE